MMSRSLLFAICCLILAYIFSKYRENNEKATVKAVILSWENITRDVEPAFVNILVGFNACTDLIVRGTTLLDSLEVRPGLSKDHSSLNSLQDLQETFAHFFSRGAAAERPFLNEDIFAQIIDRARNLDHVHWSLGGNAALIAQKMSEISPKSRIELVGPVGPKLKELVNDSIRIPASSLTERDEVHLIMEYEVGEKWGGYMAPVATRFITSHDQLNSEARYMETLFDSVPSYKPDLIIFSGLHMLEGTEEVFWRQRLEALEHKLPTVPAHIPVHLELASMSKAHLLAAIADTIFEHVTAIGLNEQELTFLNAVKSGPDHAKMSAHHGQPLVHQVTEVLTWILKTHGRTSDDSTSRLTRVHFHSLTYHIIATVPGYWQHTNIGVAAGTKMAGHQACDFGAKTSKDVKVDQLQLQIEESFKLHNGAEEIYIDGENPVMNFEYAGLEFVFSPVLVCKKPLKTVGLGDAISATGLLYSKYNRHK